jgi:hypothetical protein
MSIRFRSSLALVIVLTLIAGCGKSQPVAVTTPLPPTATLAAPTSTPMPIVPSDTLPPPTVMPAPPTATATEAPPSTPTLETALPKSSPTAEPAASSASWRKTYGGRRNTVMGDVLLAGDGGFFVVGTTNLRFEPEQSGDVYLLRTDATGEILWEKTYGGEGYDGGQSITQTGDGDLLIAGVTTSFGAEGIDAYLLKVDRDGNELWARTYGGPLDEMVGAVGQTADGDYLLGGNIVDPSDMIADPGAAGYGGFAGRSNLYLLKVDGDGNELWSRAYDSEDNVLAASGVQTADGGFLVLATIIRFPDPDDDILLTRLDENGDELWSRTWVEGRSEAYDLVETTDGNYLISASYASLEGTGDPKEDYLFIKVDPQGHEMWRNTFGDPDLIDYGAALAQTADGGYVTVGERTTDLYTWEADLVLVKIDGNGQLIWQQVWPGSHTMISRVLQYPDGEFVIAGATFLDPVFNILLLKTDSTAIDTPAPRPTATLVPPTAVPSATPTPTPLLLLKNSPQPFGRTETLQVGLGDLDGDGDLDAVFANMAANDSQVWFNDGGVQGGTPGQFLDSGQKLTQQGHGVALGDLDGDGDLDILMTCAHYGSGGGWSKKPSRVYLNDGQGRFQDSGQDFGDTELSGNGVNLIDLDGDGDLDAHIVYYEVGGMADRVYLNDGTGRFTDSGLALDEEEIAWGDLDGDGDVDILAKAYGVGYRVLLNDGGVQGGTLGRFVTGWQMQDGQAMIGDLALADLDGDGDLDALIANGFRSGGSFPTRLLWNDGGVQGGTPGQFTDNGQELNKTLAAKFAVGDLDGDGSLDVFVSNADHRPSEAWLNDGTGRLADSGLRLQSPSRHLATWPSLGDLDGDGDLDVVEAGFEGKAEVWLNRTPPVQATTNALALAMIINCRPCSLSYRRGCSILGAWKRLFYKPSSISPRPGESWCPARA